MNNLIPEERIEKRIFLIRGQKVMLDRDLAELYEVPTKRLNEQVKRNTKRFPADFMFQLSNDETTELVTNCDQFSRSQNATLKRGQNIKYLPYAFTEHGIAMLSSVLNSDKAIEVNIAIMRAFIRLRQYLATHKDLAFKIGELERKYSKHEVEISTVFKVLKQLMRPLPEKPKRKIGFV